MVHISYNKSRIEAPNDDPLCLFLISRLWPSDPTLFLLRNPSLCTTARNTVNMDLANTLIRSVVRAFYETRHILVVDALFIHSVYDARPRKKVSADMNSGTNASQPSC